MQDIYFTPIQAAEFLGVSKYTLQNQRVQRVGPPFIKKNLDKAFSEFEAFQKSKNPFKRR